MTIRRFPRVAAACVLAVLALSAASCSGSEPAPALSRSPAANGDDGIPDTGPTTEATPAPPEPPSSAPSAVPPTPPPTSGGGGGGGNGFFISQDGTYQVEADRVVFGAEKTVLMVTPKVWLGATSETKFPKGAFLATDTGAFLSKGGAWTNASSRTLKGRVRPVDGERVLRAFARLPVSTWHYRAEAAGVRHMGPMAEDFSRAFHLGEDGRHIATVDADGVSMAAIRALIDRSSAQRHTIRSLRDELRGLAEHVRHLERGAARPGR